MSIPRLVDKSLLMITLVAIPATVVLTEVYKHCPAALRAVGKLKNAAQTGKSSAVWSTEPSPFLVFSTVFQVLLPMGL